MGKREFSRMIDILTFIATEESPAESSRSEVLFYHMTCFCSSAQWSSNPLPLPGSKGKKLLRNSKARGSSRDLATLWAKFWPLVCETSFFKSEEIEHPHSEKDPCLPPSLHPSLLSCSLPSFHSFFLQEHLLSIYYGPVTMLKSGKTSVSRKKSLLLRKWALSEFINKLTIKIKQYERQ